MSVVRQCANLRFEFKSALAGSVHWAAALPLPPSIDFEIVHTESGAKVHEGRTEHGHATLTGVIDGRSVGLFVGERYLLRVPPSNFINAAETEFSVDADENTPPKVLYLQCAYASVSLVLCSDKVNTLHWASELPLPPGIPFRVCHAWLKTVVLF